MAAQRELDLIHRHAEQMARLVRVLLFFLLPNRVEEWINRAE